MGSGNPKRIRPLLTRLLYIVIITASLAVAGVVLKQTIAERQASRDLEGFILQADKVLTEAGRLPLTAMAAGLPHTHFSENQKLQVLKRLYLYALRTGRWEEPARLATEWARVKRGAASQTLLAAAAGFRLEAGEASLGEPEQWRPLAAGPYASLYEEAVMIDPGLVVAASAEGVSGGVREGVSGVLFSRRLPPPEPARLAEAGSLMDDRRVILDAALLYLREGAFDEAWTLFEGAILPNFREPALLAAYDAGNYREARALLEKVKADHPFFGSTMKLLEADILMKLGDIKAGLGIYRRLARSSSPLSPIPFVNLYLWEPASAGEGYLRQGLELFPHDQTLVMLEYRRLKDAQEPEEALNYLQRKQGALKAAPAVQAAILLEEAASKTLTRQHRDWWRFFRRYPDFRPGWSLIARFLSLTEDWDSLDYFTQQLEKGGHRAEARFYRGYAAALRGEEERALEIWRDAADSGPALAYNRGMVLLHLGEYRAALQVLEEARLLISDAPLKRQEAEGWRALNRVEVALARTFLELGDTGMARKEILSVYQRDPAAEGAGLILEELESAGE